MEPGYIFFDRAEAGRALVPMLRDHAGRAGVLVLGVGRGGLRVAHEVACGLDAPLELLSVGRIRLPGHDYITIGGVTTDGACVLDKSRIAAAQLSNEQVAGARADAERALIARESRFRAGRPPIELSGRVAVLVDDGMASGNTMRLACALVRTKRPSVVIVASPVASEEAAGSLSGLADAVVYLASPVPVGNVALWYHDFASPDDATVRAMLQGMLASAQPQRRSAGAFQRVAAAS